MELYIAEVFDYCAERPYLVGVYNSEEKATAAIDILIGQVLENNPGTNPESRFNVYVTPVQLNGFTPASMEISFW